MNTLQFCENNVKHEGMEDLVEKCRADFKNTSISVEPCLGECGDCAEQYIAKVNDNLVTGDTTHYLYEEIQNLLN
ncbi:DUF1450 domain-containing protein [Sporomusa acidovorans]|jgi:Uncharacterized protein conserved in bacteria|uniref:BFD-like [2Fe-2S] binding domain protein n=1 Tax=Sporomusa acidovorans (strain ATCC 49682 / DSM 3132 / Mol) TaxID=1123286 RepID=A0ABZ3IW72_SPOA4|nr:DUF1450 domain-containing protein [Sporomusa acidovorans]OZC23608.1 hypothetical protein SPACI_05100 [Sporomusa acidovorans DSM 3132]SDE22327.1 Uncharacterized protein YuzB, UPF0349 family [Sporomusa acidovorans]